MSKNDSLMAMVPEPIRDGMVRFDEIFYESLNSVSPTLKKAIDLLKRGEGKRIRPLLLMLVGGSFAPITDQLINGSVFIEMFHISTLIHDDVVDESYLRRGVPSMNAIFGNRKAILIGDYVLSSAMIQAMMTNNKEVVTQLISLGKLLSEGEIFQMDVAELGNFSEENYYKIVRRKTSSLIKASMQIGASLSGVEDEETKESIGEAGELLGIAFQIRDDIFDFLPTKNLGKPAGQDVMEHKVTLPLIYALSDNDSEAEKVKKLLRHRDLKSKEINYIIDFTIRKGGIEYAERIMKEKIDAAKEILTKVIPDGENKVAMLQIADYIGYRKK
ncbi:polyprenyl synthetase family protein [Porphyromonadaceae bacterium W3.11]|nr:polyprenyl synthetase family protein [Porphyromonadaceae bacterium W3.11]